MKRKFINFPRLSKNDNYQCEIDQFVSYASAIEEIECVYQYGSINSIGLSDIDILLITRDNINAQGAALISDLCSSLSQKNEYDICSYKVLPLSLFNKINRLGKIETRLLYGDKPIELELYDQTQSHINVFDVLDWLPERINNIENTLQNKIINVTTLMGDLYSMAHSLRRVLFFYKNVQIKKYLDELDVLRSSWFNRDKEDSSEILLELSFSGLFMAQKELRNFIDFLQKEDIAVFPVTHVDSYCRFHFNRDRFMSFENNLNYNSFTAPSFVGEYIKLQVNYCSGDLRNILEKCFDFEERQSKIIFDETYLEVFKERCSLSSSIYSFIINNKIDRRRLYRFGHLSC